MKAFHSVNSPYKASRSCHRTIYMISVLGYDCHELHYKWNMGFQQLDIWTGRISISFQALHNTSIRLQHTLSQFIQVVNLVVVILLTLFTHIHCKQLKQQQISVQFNCNLKEAE
jgi:hypothetical protein